MSRDFSNRPAVPDDVTGLPTANEIFDRYPEPGTNLDVDLPSDVVPDLDLVGLVAHARRDPGAPFAHAAAIAAIRRENPAQFETLRAQLRLAGCRVSVLDTLLDKADRRRAAEDDTAAEDDASMQAEARPEALGARDDSHQSVAPPGMPALLPRSQATRLVDLTLAAGVELFHTAAGESYITVQVNGHREHHPLSSRGARDYLNRLFYAEQRKALSATALQAGIATLGGIAQFDGPEHDVHVRVAGHGDRIYLDLCDPNWRAVEITSDGWRVISDPPVRFRRPRGVLALPEPVRGGSISDLRRFVNVATDEDFVLLVAWELAALRPNGPYPILVFMAEQGAAKTTTTRVLRRLCDPNSSDVRRPPRNTEDLMIAASNGHVVAFDNLSRLPEDLSDNLSVLATGGGFAVRQLYTNQDEQIFNVQRPIIVNGISQVATRGDLLDRAIVMTLPSIPENLRKDEATFWRDFIHARPRILGALIDAVSFGLRRLNDVRLDRMPRMADFAMWGVATEPACPWPAGMFLKAYAGTFCRVGDSCSR